MLGECKNCTGYLELENLGQFRGMCGVCTAQQKQVSCNDQSRRLKTELIATVCGAIVFAALGYFICYQVNAGGVVALPRILAVVVTVIAAVTGVEGLRIFFTGLVFVILGYGGYLLYRLVELEKSRT